jgi:hypothetical protein
MAFLNSQDNIRSVEWGRSYLWDIQFTDPSLPIPFNSWFPAKDIEEDYAHIDSHTWDAGINSYKIPQKSQPLNVRITFYDNSNNDLLNWLQDWMNALILNEYAYVATISTAAKFLQILKLTPDRQTLSTNSYWVYPEGTLTYMGNSESNAISYSQNFVIVG